MSKTEQVGSSHVPTPGPRAGEGSPGLWLPQSARCERPREACTPSRRPRPPLSVLARQLPALLCTRTPSHTARDLSVPSYLLVCLCLCLSVCPSVSLQNLHQLKQIQTLKQMNEQLQAENRALARVVARLSRSLEASETQEL